MSVGAQHPASEVPRAQIVGTGLIGGSIGLALRRRGWAVTGWDLDPARAERAVSLGALDRVGRDPDARITFVATPAGAVEAVVRDVLVGSGVVTDVAGVKRPLAEAVDHPRFVGGHPMAGSEQEGVDGADPDLFVGATWVLTPTDSTSPAAYATVASVVTELGANPVAVGPADHDALVALVSHVPHLTAATLMNLAADAAHEQRTLLQMAAGGFRDMTRIAAGQPGIWPDVCVDNRTAILAVVDSLTSALGEVRRVVEEGDREGLLKLLHRAREARINLPTGAPAADDTVELRIPVPDRPGVLAEVTTTLGSLGVNIYDLEIAHSGEGDRGVLVVVVAATDLDPARGALTALDYRLSARRVGS